MIFTDNNNNVWIGLQYDVDSTPILGLDMVVTVGDHEVSGDITGASASSPIVITAAAHGLQNGDSVLITRVKGNWGANGTWTVANRTADTFELTGSEATGTYLAATGEFFKGVVNASGLVASYQPTRPGWYMATIPGNAELVEMKQYRFVAMATNDFITFDRDEVASARR